MIDGHIHIEGGEYSLAWINKFVDKAIENNIDEIWLLEYFLIHPGNRGKYILKPPSFDSSKKAKYINFLI